MIVQEKLSKVCATRDPACGDWKLCRSPGLLIPDSCFLHLKATDSVGQPAPAFLTDSQARAFSAVSARCEMRARLSRAALRCLFRLDDTYRPYNKLSESDWSKIFSWRDPSESPIERRSFLSSSVVRHSNTPMHRLPGFEHEHEAPGGHLQLPWAGAIHGRDTPQKLCPVATVL
jgi:hypothetical protein